MMQRLAALLCLFLAAPTTVFSQLVINEIDSDTPGADTEEFIEIFDGGTGNTPLDDYIIVLYNGNNDASYKIFTLEGQTTNAQGFFVLGSATVTNVSYTPSNFTSIQNGGDAVALFLKSDTVDYSGVTMHGLIDAVVYDNGQADDPGLLVLLNPGEPQVNENMNGNGTTESLQRIPDGGIGKSTSNFKAATPTPGTANFIYDTDSDIQNPSTQIAPTFISSLNDTDTEFTEVFNFQITDKGTADGIGTFINAIEIESGGNVGDLTTILAGARLKHDDGTILNDQVNINSSSIGFHFTTAYEVPNGTAIEVILEVYLKKNVNDNDTLSFEIPALHSFIALFDGSAFPAEVTGTIGNIHIIQVTGTDFVFAEVPAAVDVYHDFSITLNSVDENGNLDVDDNSSEVTLSMNSGNGVLTSTTGLTKGFSEGSVQWTDLQYDVVEDFSIEAAGTLASAISSPITASPLETRVYFEMPNDVVSESSGSFTININIDYPDNSTETSADVVLVSGNATLLNNFSTKKILFQPGSSEPQSVNLNFEDNFWMDGDKNFVFELQNVSGGNQASAMGNVTCAFTIQDDEIPSQGDVIISEIMYDSKSSTDEEWIELYNTTENPINISGWYITDNDSYPATGEGDIVIPDSTYIHPSQYLVIAWKPLSDFEGAVMAETNSGWKSIGPGLGNTGDNLALFSKSDGSGILIDGSLTINYNDASPANEGFSIERDIINNGYEGTWIASEYEYGGAEIVKGTPGFVNSTQFTRVQFANIFASATEDIGSIEINLSLENPDLERATNVDMFLLNGDSLDIDAFSTTTVTFPAGSSEQQSVVINITDDSVPERTDSLIFGLANISGGAYAVYGDSTTFLLTIDDNDTTTVQFLASSGQVNENDGSFQLKYFLQNPDPEFATTFEVVMDVENSSGTSEDIEGFISKEIIIEPGEGGTDSLTLFISDDSLVEGDEKIIVNITSVSGGNKASAGANKTFQLTIIDNDLTTLEFGNEALTVTEDEGQVNIPLLIHNPHPDQETEVEVVFLKSISTGDSADIADFEVQKLIFPAGDANEQSFTLNITDDILVEGEEELYFTLKNISGGNDAYIGKNDSLKVIINDNDLTEVAFKTTSAEILEGEGSIELIIQILNPHSEVSTTLDITIDDQSTGDSTDLDNYQTHRLVFEPGEPEEITITIPITDDDLLEDDETIAFRIVNVEGGNEASAGENLEYILTIKDNDFTSINFRTVSGSVNEGDGFYNIIVDIDKPDPENPLLVDVVLVSSDEQVRGDASDINNFEIQTLEFNGSAESDTLKLIITDDLVYEGDEILVFQLENIRGGKRAQVLEPYEFTLQIKENDEPEPDIIVEVTGFDGDFGKVVYPESSGMQSYIINAEHLKDDLVITPPSGFELSLMEEFENEVYSNELPLNISSTNGKIDPTEIFVRFTPLNPDAKYYTGEIIHQSTDSNIERLAVFGEEGTLILTSIAEVRLSEVNKFFNVSGIVTTPDFGFERGEFYIQDYGNAGIKVVFPDQKSEVSTGDSIVVTGVTHYENEVFLIATEIHIIEEKELPSPLVIEEEELIVTSQLLGSRVMIEKVYIDARLWPVNALGPIGGGTLVPAEVNGHNFNIFIDAGESFYDGRPVPNDPFTLTGILCRDGEEMIIMPFFEEDIDDPNPVITINKPEIDFGSVEIGLVSETVSYTVSGEELVDNIVIKVPEGFELSSGPEMQEFSTELILAPDEDGNINHYVSVRFRPESDGDLTGMLTHSSTHADEVYVNVVGTGYQITVISRNIERRFSIYPIPAIKSFTISFNEIQNGTLILYNSLGEEVLRKEVFNEAVIDVSLIPAGLYNAIIMSENKVENQKVLIVK